MSPPSGIERFIPVNTFFWNPHALTTYVSYSALYICPLMLVFNKRLLTYRELLIPAFILGCIYLFFPIQVSEVTRLQNNIYTVGLIHKLLISLAGNGPISDIILFIFFSLGIWMVIIFLTEDIIAVKSRKIPYSILLSGIFYLFLIVMPFSYQIWEKYLLMIIPVISLRLGFLFPEFLQKKSQSPGNSAAD